MIYMESPGSPIRSINLVRLHTPTNETNHINMGILDKAKNMAQEAMNKGGNNSQVSVMASDIARAHPSGR